MNLIKDDIEGQAEIKIHKPSDRRKKATIEIRRLTGHGFEAVEKVKDIVIQMLDSFSSGESISKVIIKAKVKSTPYTPIVKKVSLSVKLLSCGNCVLKTKNMPALKQHIITNHNSKKSSCDVCGFESYDQNVKDHI